MTQKTKDQSKKAKQAPPLPVKKMTKQEQTANENEVAGRHKNDGQKDHKGAR